MKLYRITLDEGEEDFYVIAESKWMALGYLLEAENGVGEDCLNRLQFWGETEVKNGAILS